ncbi:TfuA-like protein [Nitrososphaera viennensis]|uniref:TfuA-like protein n=2 Tax=Nitrososphaera viennensis TaxID=1034015 RepID=A0A977IGV6_9ARCH|nr:TfuA-like protein [Nitrososphaera viennensis]AIC15637.1 putative TfuA domain- containing protein [Nitrososphaera viennensis EN76]UVS70512.1 TfuA-like protein [Nitrososphaera viennensis]
MAKPIIIFLGPSLSHEKARKILPEAEFRPPAKKGDLLRLAASPDVSMVGLVDGVFLQDYPPTPIEVYQLARREGVLLAGAASLGALRAVELEKFGMVGIGRVFELYKSGKIDADDEVAVTFADGDFHLQSEAMVDIRYNLFLAHKRGIIGKDTKKVLAKVAKGTYFPHRNYPDIIEAARQKYRDDSLHDDIDAFQAYIEKNRKSLKEMDAIKLVEFFRARLEATEKK